MILTLKIKIAKNILVKERSKHCDVGTRIDMTSSYLRKATVLAGRTLTRMGIQALFRQVGPKLFNGSVTVVLIDPIMTNCHSNITV